MNHRATPPKSKQIFKKKKTKDCYKSSKIKIKIIYKLNCQSNIPQFFCWLKHPSSSFPLSASPVTYPPKPTISNFCSFFVFLIASSCFSERLRLGFERLWTVLLRWCFGSVGREVVRQLEAILFET